MKRAAQFMYPYHATYTQISCAQLLEKSFSLYAAFKISRLVVTWISLRIYYWYNVFFSYTPYSSNCTAQIIIGRNKPTRCSPFRRNIIFRANALSIKRKKGSPESIDAGVLSFKDQKGTRERKTLASAVAPGNEFSRVVWITKKKGACMHVYVYNAFDRRRTSWPRALLSGFLPLTLWEMEIEIKGRGRFSLSPAIWTS